MTQTWLPELIYAEGRFQSGRAIVCDESGRISNLAAPSKVENPVRLNNRALLPGLVNAHSHAFQRVIRGCTEQRTQNAKDNFWTWRETMYSAANRLTPEALYDASRMAFLEMVLSGITAVGEFHYIHNQPDGTAYDDPNLLAMQVVSAARDVGLRIALLRVAYARAGYQTEPDAQQSRFIEKDPDTYLQNFAKLRSDLASKDIHPSGYGTPAEMLDRGHRSAPPGTPDMVWTGIAPHSVRAVPLDYLKEVMRFANEQRVPIHMHVAEQPAEVSACIEEYGRSPVALLETEGLLSDLFTAVHAIHVTPKAAWMLGQSRAMVCACPTTERNLGDGVVPIDEFLKQGVRVSLGTDSHVQIDLLEDARELEYHLRLQKMERAVLAGRDHNGHSALAARLFTCASRNGAESIGAPGGELEPARPADFFTVDLNDPSIAGADPDDLLSSIVFSLSKTAVKDVVVGGKQIVEEGRHPLQEEIVERFTSLQKKLWA